MMPIAGPVAHYRITEILMADEKDKGMTYKDAGVVSVSEEGTFKSLIDWVSKTMEGRSEIRAEVGLYATVIEVGANLGIAMSTDGVGTKILVAEMMDRFDTVGIDCVAMNVNDLICVGAKPLAMLDYIAVEDATAPVLGEIGKGLYEGAVMADISIPAGEVAQLREMIKGVNPGKGFDLVGTALGTVPLDRMVVGEGIVRGDVVVGVASSGLHSNGYTLARKVLLEKFGVDKYMDDLGRTVGEALLEPTTIYVRPVLEALLKVPEIKAVIHITGEGFRNLQRTRSPVEFHLDALPEAPPIFQLLQKEGKISNAEMANTYNMGVGLCLVVPEARAEETAAIFHEHNLEAWTIGRAGCDDPDRSIHIPSLGVVGKLDKFHKA